MNIGRVLFMAIFLFSVTTLLTVSSALESVSQSEFLPLSYQNEIKSQQKQNEIENSYKENLLKVLNDFTKNQAALSDTEMRNLENQLLALTVPANFKNLHFQLVTALVNANANDASAKKTAKNNLESLINQYGWLAAKISFFIVNYF